MSLQKRFISVILVLLLAIGMMYAGRMDIKSPEGEEEITAWYSRSDTIYFWYSDPELSDYINKAAVDFGEMNNVHVFPMLITVENYIETVNQASIYNDQMPDVYMLDTSELEMAALTGLATEINDAAGVCNTSNFSQVALNAVTYDGVLMGYPLYYNTSALVYNKDYLQTWAGEKALAILTEEAEDYVLTDYLANVNAELEEANESDWVTELDEDEIDHYEIDSELVPYVELSDEEKETVLANKTAEVYETALPETLNELLTIANTFNATNGAEGVMTWDVSDIFYNFWMVGDVMNLGGECGDDKSQISLNNEGSRICLNYYQYLNEFFYIEADSVDYEDVVQDFIDGKMLFTIASADVVATLEQAKEDGRIAFEYDFAMLPDINEEIASRSMSTTTAIVVNGYSEKKELANAFAAYLVNDFADELYARSGRPSANIHANAKYSGLAVFDEEYSESVPLPKIIELENIWMELEALFSRIWSGEDVEEEVENLDKTVNLFFL